MDTLTLNTLKHLKTLYKERLPKSLELTKEMCLAAVTSDGHDIYYVPKELLDREMCLAAVIKGGAALLEVPKELRDREICLAAVTRNGFALMDVPYELRDRKMCLAAVRKDKDALNYHVPDELRQSIKDELGLT